jgi:hypothetical protein
MAVISRTCCSRLRSINLSCIKSSREASRQALAIDKPARHPVRGELQKPVRRGALKTKWATSLP